MKRPNGSVNRNNRYKGPREALHEAKFGVSIQQSETAGRNRTSVISDTGTQLRLDSQRDIKRPPVRGGVGSSGPASPFFVSLLDDLNSPVVKVMAVVAIQCVCRIRSAEAAFGAWFDDSPSWRLLSRLFRIRSMRMAREPIWIRLSLLPCCRRRTS